MLKPTNQMRMNHSSEPLMALGIPDRQWDMFNSLCHVLSAQTAVIGTVRYYIFKVLSALKLKLLMEANFDSRNGKIKAMCPCCL